MAFDIKVWRRYYDRVTTTGALARDNLHALHHTGSCDLSRDNIEQHLKDADALCKQSTLYMNAHGIPAVPAKWIYDNKDAKTHASSPEFEFSHLICNCKKTRY